MKKLCLCLRFIFRALIYIWIRCRCCSLLLLWTLFLTRFVLTWLQTFISLCDFVNFVFSFVIFDHFNLWWWFFMFFEFWWLFFFGNFFLYFNFIGDFFFFFSNFFIFTWFFRLFWFYALRFADVCLFRCLARLTLLRNPRLRLHRLRFLRWILLGGPFIIRNIDYLWRRFPLAKVLLLSWTFLLLLLFFNISLFHHLLGFADLDDSLGLSSGESVFFWLWLSDFSSVDAILATFLRPLLLGTIFIFFDFSTLIVRFRSGILWFCLL